MSATDLSPPVGYPPGGLAPACVDAALGLIAEQGIEAVTLRAVARRIGVSRSAPYRHFVDKRALLAACAARGFARLTEQAEQVLATHEAIDITALRAMMTRYAEIGRANPALYRLMFAWAFAPADNPELAAAGDTAFATLYAAISAGQASGHLRAGDTYARVITLWSSVHGLVSLCNDLAPGEKFDTRDWAGHLGRMLDVLETALACE